MCHSIPRSSPRGWSRNDCISLQFDACVWSTLCLHIFSYMSATLTFPPNLHFGVATSSYGLEAYHLLNVKNECLFYLRNRKLAHYKGRRIALLVNQSKFNKDFDLFQYYLPNRLLWMNVFFVRKFSFLRRSGYNGRSKKISIASNANPNVLMRLSPGFITQQRVTFMGR